MNFLKGIHKLIGGVAWTLTPGWVSNPKPDGLTFLERKKTKRRVLKVFISSPSDVPAARQEALRQAQRLNNDPDIATEFQLEILRWEESAPPIVGVEPQSTVNEYTGRAGEADIVICVFGRRFGTDFILGGRHYPSGTFYEFKDAERARRRHPDLKPKILLYRMLMDPPPDESREDAEQAANVEDFFRKFRKSQGRKPVYEGYYKEYRKTTDFGTALAGDLRRVILKEFSRQNVWAQVQSLANRLGLMIDPEASRKELIRTVRREWVNKARIKMTAGAIDTFEIKFRVSKGQGVGTGRYPPSLHPEDLLTIFDQADHQLLILGRPGAGKTFKLLELTGALLERAEDNPTMPIPVVFNLSSWAGRGQPIADWLVSVLVSVYHLPRKLAQRWVDDENIVLCLDGLDEITTGGAESGSDQEDKARRWQEDCRRACLEELNKYIEGTGFWMALCCREEEYAALGTELRTRQRDTLTIIIEPLSDSQIKAYLDTQKWELESLHEAMALDNRLREMARTPYLLTTTAIAYRDTSLNVILESSEGGGKARLMDLFNRYVWVCCVGSKAA